MPVYEVPGEQYIRRRILDYRPCTACRVFEATCGVVCHADSTTNEQTSTTQNESSAVYVRAVRCVRSAREHATQ